MENEKSLGELINKLVMQYTKTFHDTLPLRWMGLSDIETVELLVDCLVNNKPYEFKKPLPEDAIL